MATNFNYYKNPSRLTKLCNRAFYSKYFRLDLGTAEELISEEQLCQCLDAYFSSDEFFTSVNVSFKS